jgi:beta propeller repeat protein
MKLVRNLIMTLGLLFSLGADAGENKIKLPRDSAVFLKSYGDKMVYTDNDDGNVYLYDTGTKEERQITFDPSNQLSPCIGENYVAWEDYREGNSKIYIMDLRTGIERPVCWGDYPEVEPSIEGNELSWGVLKNGQIEHYSRKIPSSADLNGDRNVDFLDYSALAQNWMKEGDFLEGDIKPDGIVDLEDLIILSEEWLN